MADDHESPAAPPPDPDAQASEPEDPASGWDALMGVGSLLVAVPIVLFILAFFNEGASDLLFDNFGWFGGAFVLGMALYWGGWSNKDSAAGP